MSHILQPAEWADHQARHQERVDTLLAEHLRRRRLGQPHPVEDFLFTYYSYKPAQLRRWHPGVGTLLLGDGARAWLRHRYYAEFPTSHGDDGPTGVGLDTARFTAERGDTVRFVAALLRAVESRPPHLGCFGLHEWAMVYRAAPEEIRHSSVPLRLGPAGTDRVVESHRIRCSHYDAFRFFTPEARGRNRLRPTRADQIALEQPGCLHSTMDCYKWAYKLAPAVPGELLLDCFELARDIRETDMRASPYDLSGYGYSPIRIETPEGKAEYIAAQRAFANRGSKLRAALLRVCASLGAGERSGLRPNHAA